MKPTYILSTMAAAAVALLPVSPAQITGSVLRPSSILPKKDVTQETVQAYLQAEREILGMINYDDEEAEAENAEALRGLVSKFHTDFPRPLAAAMPKAVPCPEWLVNALKEEHTLLMELIAVCRPADKAVRDKFVESTNASRAIYEAMLLSHAALQQIEGRTLETYIAEPTWENALAAMGALEFTDMESFFYRMGFAYAIFKTYPDKLADLLDAVTVTGEDSLGAGAVSEALWILNTDEAVAARMAWPHFVQAAADAQRPDFHHIENIVNNVEEAQLLDCAWGVYDATHDEEVLRSFIRCAVRPEPPVDGVRFWAFSADSDREAVPAEIGDLISLTARWSVRSRAKQNPEFAQKVEAIVSGLTEEEQARFNAPLPQSSGGEYHQN